MIHFLEYSRLFVMLFTKGDQCDTIHREEEGVFVLNDTLPVRMQLLHTLPQQMLVDKNVIRKSLFADGTHSFLFVWFFFF